MSSLSRSGRTLRLILLAVLCLVALTLAACDSEEEAAPQLAAPPTRTPVPVTDTPEPGADSTLTID